MQGTAMIGESLPDIEPLEIEGKDPVTVSWELLEN
jgi:hypothetical protein